MDTFDQIKELVDSMQTDVEKVENNQNKSAGKRARKSAQEIKNLCGTLRKEIMDSIR